MPRNILGFSIAPNMSRVMGLNGFYASIMKAEKKKEDGDTSLPSGMPIPVLPVDYLKSRPDFWVGGEGSYVCPVDSNWGLWFNFSLNNPKESAVLTSVKGMNPITGQRMKGFGIEQYKNKCPIHDVKFQHGHLCPECGFKWPQQNYLSGDPMWLDGFRTEDGKVRQFYFTEEMSKSIPELVIGRDDTVPAFGFCFYSPKVTPEYEGGRRMTGKMSKDFFTLRSSTDVLRGARSIHTTGFSSGGSGMMTLGDIHSKKLGYPGVTCSTSYTMDSMSKDAPMIYMNSCSSLTSDIHINADMIDGIKGAEGLKGPPGTKGWDGRLKKSAGGGQSLSAGEPQDLILHRDYCSTSDSRSFSPSLEESLVEPERKAYFSRPANAEVGVGAGAEINQAIREDRRAITDWQEKPAATMRIYFVFQEEFERYVDAGLNVLKGEKEGFLSGLPVGVAHE